MLFDRLAKDAEKWRSDGYPCPEYPLIGEILRHQCATAPGDDRLHLRYLRDAQFRALEVYWFVRLQKATPRMMDLYENYYAGQTGEFCRALGLPIQQQELQWVPNVDSIITRITGDKDFVKEKKIEAVAEMAALDYPSYILALAMGAGKTVLIGAIIATEFAMAMAYKSAGKFMRNALVFAPGKTILESLREIESMPFGEILPPSLTGEFNANLKIEYAREGVKDIAVQNGSSYNIIVSNTERIRLRAAPQRNNGKRTKLDIRTRQYRNELEANLRLQTIASLPDLGVFSDEAHHVYGETAERELKRARETVNYIHEKTPLIAVVNTTGTPYVGKQPLREVVFWYGLKEGIADGVLKDLNRGIVSFRNDRDREAETTAEVIREFFDKYRDVRLPNGAKAKIAFYFRHTEHLAEMRKQIEDAMIHIGEDISQILVCTSDSQKTERDEFNRLNNPDSPKRVMLLVNIGTEGWNCPSLFACALMRRNTNSVFVLQAATRCLRQTPGNTAPASIFLSTDNSQKLDKELQNNFRINRTELGAVKGETVPVVLRLRKESLPKLEITRTEKRVVAVDRARGEKKIRLKRPKKRKTPPDLVCWIMSPRNWDGRTSVFVPDKLARTIKTPDLATDCRSAAIRIAANYHLPPASVYRAIKDAYPGGKIPKGDFAGLLEQIEEQTSGYKIEKRTTTEALALIRLIGANGEELFERDAEGRFHRIRYSKLFHDRLVAGGLMPKPEDPAYADSRDLSFHYAPYNLASAPERAFLEQMLAALNQDPDDVAAFLYTGGVADVRKTDFHFEYKGVDDKYHRYFPDFILVKKTGEFYVVEIKADNMRGDATVAAKEKAVEEIRALNPKKVRHEVIYCRNDAVDRGDLDKIRRWLYAKKETPKCQKKKKR